MTAPVVTDFLDSTAIIRFDRPASRNSLSQDVLNELEKILPAMLERTYTSSIIFTGTADVFASGADIQELTSLGQETAYEFSKRGQSIFGMIAGARQRTIAAINGYCMGGALDLVLSCDIRIASSKAVFAHPGARLGIITGWGGTQRLPRLIGRARGRELFLTGRRVQSDEALEIGLIDEIYDPVLDRALTLSRS